MNNPPRPQWSITHSANLTVYASSTYTVYRPKE